MVEPHQLNLVKNNDLHVKLSESQKKKIVENAETAGFKSLSDFVRHIALDEGYTMEQRIQEIHEAILGQKNQAKQTHVHKQDASYGQHTVPDNYAAYPQEYEPFNENYNS